jgi:MFS family permease
MRSRHPAQAAGWILAILAVLLLVPTLVLLGLNASHVDGGRIFSVTLLALAAVAYAGAGRVITGRLPGNAIGWLLGLVGLSVATATFTEQYALYGLVTARGSVPEVGAVAALAGATGPLTISLLLPLILLFPDGRLPSPRWRPVLWAIIVVMAGWGSQLFQAGTKITGGLTNALDAAHADYPNPSGFLPRHGWYSDFLLVIFVLGIVTGILVVASVFARRRGAGPELRKQLAWLGYIGVLTAVWVFAQILNGLLAPPSVSNGWLGTTIWGFMELTPVAGIPAAVAVAVLKYRLYEIDRIISRTLAYAIVTGLLVGIYAGLVLLATQVLSITSPVAVAAATLAAAALFTPLRSRVQRLVDRRFNRTRYDADRTLTAFAARLKDAVDQDAVRADLLGVVQRSLEPTHAAVWVRPRG